MHANRCPIAVKASSVLRNMPYINARIRKGAPFTAYSPHRTMAPVQETSNSAKPVASTSTYDASPVKEEKSLLSEPKGTEALVNPSPTISNYTQGIQTDSLLPGLGMQLPQAHSRTDRSDDYTRKYRADQKGNELNSDGRLWKVYLDESENYDSDMVAGFRNTIDATLVFAALFSSVVTGFVIESSKKLEPDYAKINVSLLIENNKLLRAGNNASMIETVPESSLGGDSVTHSSQDVWMAWMFITSLSLALVTALLSILVKQWLQTFTTIIPGDAKERCLIRQLRFTGLKKWKVSEIINTLPLFLHVSLALFFVGLGLFVREFDVAIRIIVDVVAGGSYFFYLITVTLAAIHVGCPYRLPVLYNPVLFVLDFLRELLGSKREDFLTPFLSSPLFRERELVLTLPARFEALCIDWLFTESTNASVQKISFDAAVQFSEQHASNHGLWQQKLFGGSQDGFLLLPLTELCQFALRLMASLPSSLMDSSPSFRFLVTYSVKSPKTLPPSAWHTALRCPKLLNAFIDHKVPLDVQYTHDGISGSPFQHACFLGNWDAATALLPHSTPPQLAPFGPDEFSPLMMACRAPLLSDEKRLNIVRLLLQRDSDIGNVDSQRRNALHFVILFGKGSPKVLEELLSSIPKNRLEIIDQRDHEGNTPLLLACYLKQVSSIRCLLLANANPNISSQGGCIPLHKVCESIEHFTMGNDFTLFEMLVNAMGDTDFSPRTEGETPLDSLVSVRQTCDPEMFKKAYNLLRAKGAHCNSQVALQPDLDTEMREKTE